MRDYERHWQGSDVIARTDRSGRIVGSVDSVAWVLSSASARDPRQRRRDMARVPRHVLVRPSPPHDRGASVGSVALVADVAAAIGGQRRVDGEADPATKSPEPTIPGDGPSNLSVLSFVTGPSDVDGCRVADGPCHPSARSGTVLTKAWGQPVSAT